MKPVHQMTASSYQKLRRMSHTQSILLRASLQQVLLKIGRYGEYELPELNYEFRLIFVCAGNVCRSPYAEYRAREMGIDAASAGVLVENSCSPPREALLCARKRGLDLSGHVSGALREADLCRNDVIVVMEPWQADAVRGQLVPQDVPITLLGLWSTDSIASIPDPMGADHKTFDACYEFIDRSIERISQVNRD